MLKAGLLQRATWKEQIGSFQFLHCCVVSLPLLWAAWLCALIAVLPVRDPAHPRGAREPVSQRTGARWLRLRERSSSRCWAGELLSERGPSWSEVRVPPGAVPPELARPPALGHRCGRRAAVCCCAGSRSPGFLPSYTPGHTRDLTEPWALRPGPLTLRAAEKPTPRAGVSLPGTGAEPRPSRPVCSGAASSPWPGDRHVLCLRV